MTSQRRIDLTIVAPKRYFELALPPATGVWSSTKFEMVTSQMEPAPQRGASPDSLTVVMEAESFSPNYLHTVSGRLWLWLSRPLAISAKSGLKGKVKSTRLVEAGIQRTRELLHSLSPSQVEGIIVVDNESHEVVQSLGFDVVTSPPPVSDTLLDHPLSLEPGGKTGTFSSQSQHRRVYFDQLEPHGLVPANLDEAESPARLALEGIQIGVNIHADGNRGFPFSALLHLAAGHTLISEPLWPLYGLEPGLDYFEVTSPSELFHVLQYLDRSPETTKLMAYRGSQKSQDFRASTIFERLLERFS